MSVAIKIENLSKQYRLGLIGTGTLSHDLKRWWHLVRGKEDPFLRIGEVNDRSTKSTSDYVWALKDINLEVKQGEVLGIIGKNGAGKSTLLKILSRVTAPTTGSITYNGRIGSLLEAGTGFHSELTGRENIFLNGAILGMRKNEIERKFDEIVDFSGCERYIDTPVKRYSSGMIVRLGFAVAAFLEPEILVVDEVLAVGDAEFQKKAIGKMQNVSKTDGRTVLFVSHNMTSIQALCSKAIYLKDGTTTGLISVKEAVDLYFNSNWQNIGHFKKGNLQTQLSAEIIEAKLLNEKNKTSESFLIYERIIIEITWVNRHGVNVNPNFVLINRQGITVMVAVDTPIDWNGDKKNKKGTYISRAIIPGNLLNANDYSMHISLDSGSPRLCYESNLDVFRFKIIDSMDEKNLARGNFSSVVEDAVLWPVLEWNFTYLEN
jgi:lipopolysaccharide transport system ATP-binding protein